jgi:hypothetical protein
LKEKTHIFIFEFETRNVYINLLNFTT